MDILHNRHKKIDDTIFINMDTDLTVIKFIIPVGFADEIQKSGYAHLIEHMIVQANKRYLTYLEKQGVQFNAETKDFMTEFIFIDLQNDLLLNEMQQGKLKKIFEVPFRLEHLDIEKKTIMEEHLLLCSKMTQEEVNDMIGNIQEIEKFELNKVNIIKHSKYLDVKTIVFSNSVSADVESNSEEHVEIEREWFKKVRFLKILYQDDKANIWLTRTIYAEILVFCLRILLCDMIKEYSIQIRREKDRIQLILHGNIKAIRNVMQYKKNSFYRYFLLLSTIKFFCTEVIYIIQYLFQDIDIEKIYFETNWEENFCDKIISKK